MIEELLNANDWKPIAGNTYYPLLLFIITIVVIINTMTIVIITTIVCHHGLNILQVLQFISYLRRLFTDQKYVIGVCDISEKKLDLWQFVLSPTTLCCGID